MPFRHKRVLGFTFNGGPRKAAMAGRRAGDAARNRLDWPAAEDGYRTYLDTFPEDGPMLVQFGHALKEQGKLRDALSAYERALAASGSLTDAGIHLRDLHRRLAHAAQTPSRQPAPRRAERSALPLPPPGSDSAKLLQFTSQARENGTWPAAALALRRLVSLEPASSAHRLQYGEALQELGLLAAARNQFREAALLAPGNPHPLLREREVALMEGDFPAANTLRSAAAVLAADVPERPGLAPHASGPTSVVRFSDEPRPSFRIFLSSTVEAPRSETASELVGFLGLSNYSYSFVIKGYIEALDRLGIAYDVVSNPEYIPHARSRSDCDVNLHIGFYPPDAPRLLKGAYNIAVVAWEFERLPLPSEIISYHAFADPNTMLRLPEEVWSISSYGAEAISASMGTDVRAVPTPVLSDLVEVARAGPPSQRTQHRMADKLKRVRWSPLGILPQMLQPMFEEAERRASDLLTILGQYEGGQRATVFITILNVHDYRKQIKPVIEAFVRVSKVHPGAVLLIKLTVGGQPKLPLNDYMFRYQMTDGSELPPPYVSDRVWLTADVLSRDEMTSFYDLADFYVSSSHGEGQNLPLIEAMGRGCVPFAVDHTAMRDYIDDANAVVIPSTLEPFNTRLADRYRMAGLRTYYVSARGVAGALDVALKLTPQEYGSKSAAALAAVKREFGLESFKASLLRAVDAATAWQGEGSV